MLPPSPVGPPSPVYLASFGNKSRSVTAPPVASSMRRASVADGRRYPFMIWYRYEGEHRASFATSLILTLLARENFLIGFMLHTLSP